MKLFIKTSAAILLLELGLGTSQAIAENAPRLLPGGIAYPEFNSEGVMNPATLNKEEARVARVLLDANIFGSSTQGLGLDYTMSWASFGLDAGYDISRTIYTGLPPSQLSHAVHAAAGYRGGPLGLGLCYTHTLGSASIESSGDLKLGLAFTLEKARLALVIDGISSSPAATLGIGTEKEGSHALEFNLGMPPLSAGLTTPGSTYSATLAVTLYLRTVGVGYQTSYAYALSDGTIATDSSSSWLNSPLGFSHSFSLLIRVTKNGSISFRFDPSNYLTLGLTFEI